MKNAKEKTLTSNVKKTSKSFNSLIEKELKQIEKEKEKQMKIEKVLNELENDIEKVNEFKLSTKEKEKLKELIKKLKNDLIKEKEVKLLNQLLEKAVKSKIKKSKSNLKDSKMYDFKTSNLKSLNLLYNTNWKINKNYEKQLNLNENEKVLYSEYIKINNIWKYEKDLIKDIEYEKVKYDLILKYCNSFEKELIKENSKDIKRLNQYFIKSNISKNIKNSKLIKENENDNIFWKNSNNYESNYILKINDKYIIDLINNENPIELEKIKNHLKDIDIIKSEYHKKNYNINEYENKIYDFIVKNSNRIYEKILNHNWKIENEKQVKKDILKLYEKELNQLKLIEKGKKTSLLKHKKELSNLINKISYTSNKIKDKYWYLLSE